MSCHAVSAETQTLENTSYDVMTYHDMSSENDEWAMRDSNPRHLRCKRPKAYKRSGFVTFYVDTVLQKIASICNRLHCITVGVEENVVQVVQG